MGIRDLATGDAASGIVERSVGGVATSKRTEVLAAAARLDGPVSAKVGADVNAQRQIDPRGIGAGCCGDEVDVARRRSLWVEGRYHRPDVVGRRSVSIELAAAQVGQVAGRLGAIRAVDVVCLLRQGKALWAGAGTARARGEGSTANVASSDADRGPRSCGMAAAA